LEEALDLKKAKGFEVTSEDIGQKIALNKNIVAESSIADYLYSGLIKTLETAGWEDTGDNLLSKLIEGQRSNKSRGISALLNVFAGEREQREADLGIPELSRKYEELQQNATLLQNTFNNLES